jgi:hypothetical protein
MDDLSSVFLAAVLLSDRSSINNEARMMELEHFLHQVRTNASVLVQTTLDNERQEMRARQNEFLRQYSIASEADRFCLSQQWFLLVQTIMEHFIIQLHMEESMIHRTLYPLLDSIYSSNIGVLKVTLQQVIHCLSRAAFLGCVPYTQVVERLRNSTINDDDVNDGHGSRDVLKWQGFRQLPRIHRYSKGVFSSTITATATNHPKDGTFLEVLERRISMSKSSIPLAMRNEVLSFFQHSLVVDVDGPDLGRPVTGIRALLLMGSIGSGKTFVFNEIEQTVRSVKHPSLLGMFDTTCIGFMELCLISSARSCQS